MTLGSTFVTRDPDGFAQHLSETVRMRPGEVSRLVHGLRASHEETHRAFEFLSELALRSNVLRALGVRAEGHFDFLFTELCTFAPETRVRLERVLRDVGVGSGFFWEDLVTRR